MFHRIQRVNVMPHLILRIDFVEGITKLYDVHSLFQKLPVFRILSQDEALFSSVYVDVGGYGIVWNDELDLSCDELWDNGVPA